MMTNQEIIDVVTAAMNGKTILRKGRWVLGNPSWAVVSPSVEWDFVGYDYMVKPEPRTMYAEIMPNGRHIQSSLEPFKPTNGGTIITFKEVPSE